jgi:hypothetical protein
VLTNFNGGNCPIPQKSFLRFKKTFVSLFSKISLAGVWALQAADSVEFGLGTNPHALLEMKLSGLGVIFVLLPQPRQPV